MSDKYRSRRKRTGSTSARFKPSQLVPVEDIRPAPIGAAGIAACSAVAVVAIALIVLIWIVTSHTVQEQRAETLERAQQTLVAEAGAMAETVGHELLLIDQSLIILQAAWKADSGSFDLEKWHKEMPALTAVTDDLFICDERRIIRQDILPKAIGQGVGAAYVTSPHGSLEIFESDGTKDRESSLLAGETGASIDARQFMMYIVRALDHPDGWLIGASYRSTELTKLFAQASLGNNPVVALMDAKRGVLQAVVGPAARRPKTDLSKTPMFDAATRTPTGTWVGQTAIDGVERLHAFHRIAERDMVLLVASSMAEVMEPSDSLASGAHALAFTATALVLAIAAAVMSELYTIRSRRRQKRVMDRNRSELERLRNEEIGNIARAQLNAARLQAVLDTTADGIALFDSALRLVQWNHPFLRGIGIEPRKDMALDALLREQAAIGLFGQVMDMEAEITRRAGILRAGDTAGVSQRGPTQETLVLRGLPIAEGGFMLLLNGIATWESPPPVASTSIDEPAAPEVAPAPAPIDW